MIDGAGNFSGTLEELLALPDIVDRSEWGRWRLCAEHCVLDHYDQHGTHEYSVTLPLRRSSAELLDIIVQISHKAWGREHAVIATLVRALDDVLDLQGNLCPFGEPKTITDGRLRELVDRAVDRGAPLSDPDACDS